MKKLYDVLNYKNLKIYQDDEWFCFSLDSVILANFPKIKYRTKRIIELGTGNGIVPLILSRRTKCLIDAIEIQKDLALLAKENVIYNGLESQISIINDNIINFCCDFRNYDKYDLVLSNPPYFKKTVDCDISSDIHKAIARHELAITVEEIISSSFNILKEGGVFAMVNRVDRFMEIINLFGKYKFEVKYLRFIHDSVDKKPALFYVEVMKLGKSGLIMDRPFILKNNNGSYTDEYRKLQDEVMV